MLVYQSVLLAEKVLARRVKLYACSKAARFRPQAFPS